MVETLCKKLVDLKELIKHKSRLNDDEQHVGFIFP